MSSSIYAAVPVMLVMAVLQTAVFPRFPVLGMVPQLAFLVALSWGLQRGETEGALWAFVAGIAVDLFSAGPMGLTALAYVTAVFIASFLIQRLPQSRLFMPALMGGVATFIFLLIYIIGLRVLGYTPNLQALSALLPLIYLHTGLILPIYWLIYLFDNSLRPKPIAL